MAMVISPRSKIVTLTLLIGIVILIALIAVGFVSIWNNKPPATASPASDLTSEQQQRPSIGSSISSHTNPDTKMMSNRLQQFTSYSAQAPPKQVSPTSPTSCQCTYIHIRIRVSIHTNVHA